MYAFKGFKLKFSLLNTVLTLLGDSTEEKRKHSLCGRRAPASVEPAQFGLESPGPGACLGGWGPEDMVGPT